MEDMDRLVAIRWETVYIVLMPLPVRINDLFWGMVEDGDIDRVRADDSYFSFETRAPNPWEPLNIIARTMHEAGLVDSPEPIIVEGDPCMMLLCADQEIKIHGRTVDITAKAEKVDTGHTIFHVLGSLNG